MSRIRDYKGSKKWLELIGSDIVKLKSKTIKEFVKEIHSPEIHSRVRSFDEIEGLSQDWLNDRVFLDADRYYDSIVKRGQINNETTFEDFINKIEEEKNELNAEKGNHVRIKQELIDIIGVCVAMGKHYRIDISGEFEKKIIINEKRKD